MTQYDYLLKGGNVIDPANSIDAPMDVAVKGDPDRRRRARHRLFTGNAND